MLRSKRVLPRASEELSALRGSCRTLLRCVALAGLTACGAGTQQIPQGNQVGNANVGEAIGTAVVAGVVWAAGGGCRLQGCPYGTYCSQESGFCQTRKCSEGCPLGTVCNEGLDRCQVAPPPKPPSDFLPTDNKLTTPPTVH